MTNSEDIHIDIGFTRCE